MTVEEWEDSNSHIEFLCVLAVSIGGSNSDTILLFLTGPSPTEAIRPKPEAGGVRALRVNPAKFSMIDPTIGIFWDMEDAKPILSPS